MEKAWIVLVIAAVVIGVMLCVGFWVMPDPERGAYYLYVGVFNILLKTAMHLF